MKFVFLTRAAVISAATAAHLKGKKEVNPSEQFAQHLQELCPYQHVSLASCYDDGAKFDTCFSCAFRELGGESVVKGTKSCVDLIEMTTSKYNTCIEENHCDKKCDAQMDLLSDCALTPLCDESDRTTLEATEA
jgi:hypothetical protein